MRETIGGPWFEDLKVGQVYDDAPSVTLDAGSAALHTAITGDRLRLPLDAGLSHMVTRRGTLAHPMLVVNVVIGQTTTVTQRVRANLFYRGLVMRRPLHLGDSIHTTTEVVALRQNQRKPGRPATGLAVLRIRAHDQSGQPVMDFYRCPMIPLRDPATDTGHADDIDAISADIAEDVVVDAVPAEWNLEAFRACVPAARDARPEPDVIYEIEGRDTVTAAPALARLTGNLAAAHTDAGASPYGRRLVYGGHTIALAAAHATRAFPGMLTILAWRGCDHTGPVFEGDIVRTEVTVSSVREGPDGSLIGDLRAIVLAERGDDEEQVLDWRWVGWFA